VGIGEMSIALAMVMAAAREENGEFCITIGPIIRPVGTLTYLVKGAVC